MVKYRQATQKPSNVCFTGRGEEWGGKRRMDNSATNNLTICWILLMRTKTISERPDGKQGKYWDRLYLLPAHTHVKWKPQGTRKVWCRRGDACISVLPAPSIYQRHRLWWTWDGWEAGACRAPCRALFVYFVHWTGKLDGIFISFLFTQDGIFSGTSLHFLYPSSFPTGKAA